MHSSIKLASVGILAAVLLAALPPGAVTAGSAGSAGCQGPARGRLLDTTVLERVGREDVAAGLREFGLADSASYGVARYRLVYCTVSPSGGAVVASGLLMLPTGASGRLPVLAYAHGTVLTRTDAPSFNGLLEGRVIPMVFSAEGWAVAAPDYLGLGVSRISHPWLHAASEASATIDMLAAARAAAAQLRQPLSEDLFVTGISQGGHSAMALGHWLATHAAPWRLRALAPIAGPYDMSGIALPALLDPARTDPEQGMIATAYLLVTWKPLYALYSDPREVFAEPYAAIVEELLDGDHTIEEIEALPDSPELLLRPETLALLRHPAGRLADVLRQNDVCRWVPAVPTRIYAGRLDRAVAPEHAQRCREQIATHGGAAEIVDVGELDHVGTAFSSLTLIREWFIHLRSAQ
jgi:hypothetical protein